MAAGGNRVSGEAVKVRALVWGQEGCHGVEGVAGVAEARLLGGPVEEVESFTPGREAEDDGFRGARRKVRGEAAEAGRIAGRARAGEFVEQVMGEEGRGGGNELGRGGGCAGGGEGLEQGERRACAPEAA